MEEGVHSNLSNQTRVLFSTLPGWTLLKPLKIGIKHKLKRFGEFATHLLLLTCCEHGLSILSAGLRLLNHVFLPQYRMMRDGSRHPSSAEVKPALKSFAGDGHYIKPAILQNTITRSGFLLP